jgi:hypothetical protein
MPMAVALVQYRQPRSLDTIMAYQFEPNSQPNFAFSNSKFVRAYIFRREDLQRVAFRRLSARNF